MPPITLPDPVYGDVTFTEPLFVDLYHAEAVQRLTPIYQGGITAFIKPEAWAEVKSLMFFVKLWTGFYLLFPALS